MSQAPASITVFIPLTIRKRNGRPKIVPPADVMPANDGGVDPHILKAIAKAWSWRRRLESGQSATYADDPVKPLGPLFERDAEVEQQGPPPQSQQQRNKKHSSHGVLAVILLTLDQSTGWIVQ